MLLFNDRGIFEGACLKVGLTLGQHCYVDGQCTGTSNSVCKADQDQTGSLTCQCSTGFMRHNETCLKATIVEEQAWIADKRIQFLVIAVGGFVIITCLVCLFTTVLFALKKRKSDNQRFEYQDSTHIEIGHI